MTRPGEPQNREPIVSYRELIRILVAAATALGITVGTRQSDQDQIAQLKEAFHVHQEKCDAARRELDRFLDVSVDGFRDPRMYHAVKGQIDRCGFITQKEWELYKRRLSQLNPSITIPSGD